MNKYGQSIIEYTLIAVLVVLGIVIMGPYVLRSVGAHFKIWDDGIKDSFEENIKQAPVGDVPAINLACDCTTHDLGCGSITAGSGCQDPCLHGYSVSCIPGGCNNDPRSWCTLDVQGCSNWSGVRCGKYPLPVPPGYTNTLPAPDNCYYGYELQTQACSTVPTLQCVPNPQGPLNPTGCAPPTCTGPFVNDASVNKFCETGSLTLPTDLNQDQPITFDTTGTSSGCPSTPNCQMYCVAPYVLNSTQTACVNQCTAAQLPQSIVIPTDAQPSTFQAPVGLNYYFFNFNTLGNGIFTQSVTPASGVVTPGQTYHLKLVSGRDTAENGCIFGAHGNICDADILSDSNANLLHIRVGDQTPGGQAPYDWQILDSSYNVVFEWSGLIDFSLDVAFTGCATPPSCSFPGQSWSGYYTDSNDNVHNNDINNSYGDLYFIANCTAASKLTGICIYYDNRQSDASNYRGFSKLASCANSDNYVVACGGWQGSSAITLPASQAIDWQNCCYNSSNNNSIDHTNRCNNGCVTSAVPSNFTLNCNSGKLASILLEGGTVTPASINGCNWTGPLTLNDFGTANDMTITCDQGTISNFQATGP